MNYETRVKSACQKKQSEKAPEIEVCFNVCNALAPKHQLLLDRKTDRLIDNRKGL